MTCAVHEVFWDTIDPSGVPDAIRDVAVDDDLVLGRDSGGRYYAALWPCTDFGAPLGDVYGRFAFPLAVTRKHSDAPAYFRSATDALQQRRLIPVLHLAPSDEWVKRHMAPASDWYSVEIEPFVLQAMFVQCWARVHWSADDCYFPSVGPLLMYNTDSIETVMKRFDTLLKALTTPVVSFVAAGRRGPFATSNTHRVNITWADSDMTKQLTALLGGQPPLWSIVASVDVRGVAAMKRDIKIWNPDAVFFDAPLDCRFVEVDDVTHLLSCDIQWRDEAAWRGPAITSLLLDLSLALPMLPPYILLAIADYLPWVLAYPRRRKDSTLRGAFKSIEKLVLRREYVSSRTRSRTK